jgi:RNA polymerase sporulation-specific sigma factor
MTYDELFATGDMDLFLEKVQKHTAAKIGSKRFAGMDTEDVVQETVFKVYRSLDLYNSETSRMSTYVDHVIENMIRDCLRKCGSGKNLMVVNADEIVVNYDPSELGSDERSTLQVGSIDYGYQNAEVMMDVMNNMGLTDREKQIFQLYVEGYEFVEIAKVIGVTKSRMSQIWSKIKSKYNQM